MVADFRQYTLKTGDINQIVMMLGYANAGERDRLCSSPKIGQNSECEP